MENPFDDFFNYDPRKDLENFSKVPTETWLKLGEQKALENFQLAARTVPAYKDFLKKNKVNPEKIKTIEDFKKIPLTTKENYFRKYPLKDLVLGGDLEKATVIYSSSGSTGTPLYWPKFPVQDVNIYKGIELLFTNYYDIEKLKTLVINAFSMGPWPAGDIMHSSSKIMADRGLKVSLISPGIDEKLFFTFFKDLAMYFDQIVIGAYPSFLTNLIEEGKSRGINFKDHQIKVLTGGEKFSENWRNFLTKSLGFSKPHRSIASVLGSSETGLTSFSTPFVDYLRMFLNSNPRFAAKFFPRKDLPSITQFIPPSRFIEIVHGEIVVSCLAFVPLVRYNTKDFGTILEPNKVIETLPKNFKEDFFSLDGTNSVPKLPILAIYGRSDGTITLYALNIYPEQITQVLELTKVKKCLTGRVIIEKLETSKSEPYLKLTLELKAGIKPSNKLKENLKEVVAVELAKLNSEYSHLLSTLGNKARPVIELKAYGSNEAAQKSGKRVLIRK